MTFAAILALLWQALLPQTFPFPGPKNTAMAPPTKGVVQGCGNGNASTSISCTFSSPITAGHTLYFCVGQFKNTGNPTFSGDSGTFVADPGSSIAITSHVWNNSGSNFYYSTCKYVLSAGGGTTTITASGTEAAGSAEIVGVELFGVTTFDKSDNGSVVNSGGSTIVSQSITPASNSSLLVGVCMNISNQGMSQGTNVAWSLVPNASPQFDPPYSALESFLQPTAASVNAQCSMGGSLGNWGHIVAFH